jgi:hypothetical protein
MDERQPGPRPKRFRYVRHRGNVKETLDDDRLMPPPVVIRVLADTAQAPEAMVVVLSAKVMGHESLSGSVTVLDGVAAVEQLRVPDEHVAGLRHVHRGPQAAPFQFMRNVLPEVRQLAGNRVCLAV